MEGERGWAFSAPAFGAGAVPPPAGPSAAATYRPSGKKLRRRRGKHQHAAKRQKRRAAATEAAGGAAGSDGPPPLLALPSPPPNPAQLAPLRFAWPHPAVLDLLVQQCRPAAGPAAVLQAVPAAAAAPQRPWWNCMLPSLSLLHPPLPEQQQLSLAAGGSRDAGFPGSSSSGGAVLQPTSLPGPNVLVGYEEDWLEVAPEVLPLWQAAPLAPFAGPKTLLHYLLCPEPQLAAAQQLVADVGSVYETCNLGTHVPASSGAVRSFTLQPQAAGAAGSAGAAGQGGQQQPGQAASAAAYLAGLRGACEQLQRQLLLDPPEELQQLTGSSLEDGHEPAVLVFVACPFEGPAEQVATLLEAASCLAPCTPLGAAADAGTEVCLLPITASGLFDGAPSLQQPLAPVEPQQPDRPATTTPAADTSRAPGISLPPDEGLEGQPAAQQAPEQGQQEQRHHGAGHVLHEQQQGDFTQLPVRRVQRPDGFQPVRVVLQLLSPQALADLDGTAARCAAFAVYNKSQWAPPPGLPEPLAMPGAGPQTAVPARASLVCHSQPLVVLASAAAAAATAAVPPAGQAAAQAPVQPAAAPEPGEFWPGDGMDMELDSQQEQPPLPPQPPPQQQREEEQQDAAQPQGTLHCFYSLPPAGCSLVPLVLADTSGELLHAELLDLDSALGRMASLVMAGSSSDSLLAVAAALERGAAGQGGAARVCRLVLRRCLQVLAALGSGSSSSSAQPGLRDLAIAGSGMQAAEKEAWRQLVQQDPGLSLELPPGAELAVLDLWALPPQRHAGPDPPSGCQLTIQHGSSRSAAATEELQAQVAWLPPADGTAPLLPGEHDVVRSLSVALVCRCAANDASSEAPGGGAPAAAAAAAAGPRSEEDALRSLAEELHGLSWLHAAFQGACLQSVANGGQAAPADAHLPLHAAAGTALRQVLQEVARLLPASPAIL